jgi:U3 small nucleolar RNA-associated protein 20
MAAILFNALYYVKDDKELAIGRMRRLRSGVSSERSVNSGTSSSTTLDLVRSHLLPSLRKGAQESSELVRAEYVAVMAYLVKSSKWPEVMTCGCCS